MFRVAVLEQKIEQIVQVKHYAFVAGFLVLG